MFKNREEAGTLLYKELKAYTNNKNCVIVAIPRGGVPLGNHIAKKLNLPLEVVLSKKIGHPFHKEYAIGAVTLKNRILSEAAAEVSRVYIDEETGQIRDLLQRRHDYYYGNKSPIALNDKIVIVVDDGVATGNTLISSIKFIQQQEPAEIIVALPVAPSSAIKKIKKLPFVTHTICLLEPRNFHAVGQFYEDFSQVNDDEVMRLLNEANEGYRLSS